MRRLLRPQCSCPVLRRLQVQYKVNGGPQEVGPIRLGDERIDGVQSPLRQFQIVGQHDDWEVWLGLLDLSRNDCAIQQTQMVFENNCIHGP